MSTQPDPEMRLKLFSRSERFSLKSKGLAIALALLACASAQPLLHAQGAGYWHTSGNLILDANKKAVRISGINWSGFETPAEVVHGLYAQDYKYILDGIKRNGYNTVRVPFSNETIESPIVPTADAISYNNGAGPINGDLAGLDSLQILDRIVAYAGQIGLRIILDNHRSENGETAESNGLWYTAQYPESDWINDWETLAERYHGNSTVIGMDLRNEPHAVGTGGAYWSCASEANDWHLAAERAGNAILAINPNLLIFVEGTDTKGGPQYWWGGNLTGVKASPVKLAVAHQLVYSAHEYGPDLYAQSWFNGKTTPASLSALRDTMWGYIGKDKIAPVWLGEFGTPNDAASVESSAAGSQGQWFQGMIAYLKANPNVNWTYWDMAEDDDALLDGNWDATPVSATKQQMLASVQFKTSPPVAPKPAAPTGLTARAASSNEIDLQWEPSATAGATYSLYMSTASKFTPSSATLLAGGLTSAAFPATGLKAATTYSFVVEAVAAQGTSAASNEASAKTTPAAKPVAACHVGLSIVNDWGTGFQASLAIENTGTTDWKSWTLGWTFVDNQVVTDLWNGVASQSGGSVTVVNESYNAALAAGASVPDVGFTANYSGTNAMPASFTVNGVVCQ